MGNYNTRYSGYETLEWMVTPRAIEGEIIRVQFVQKTRCKCGQRRFSRNLEFSEEFNNMKHQEVVESQKIEYGIDLAANC